MDAVKPSLSDAVQSPAAALRAHSASRYFTGFSRSALAGPSLLFLLCCAFCWKLTLTNQFTWIDDPDVVNMDVPRLQFQRATWQNHEFPLWDPHSWSGQPFLGEIVGAAFPLNWPFFFVPRRSRGQISLTALNWYFVMLHFFGALAAYWLCRELKASRLASALGGVVYTFGGFVGVTLWPEVLSGLIVAPLVFVFQVRALRGERPLSAAALSGMFLGLSWLSGHHEIPIYISITVAAIWVYELFSHAPAWRRWLALVSVSLLFAVLASGFQTLPGYEYARHALRWVGTQNPVTWAERVPYQIDSQYSFAPSSLVSLVVAWSGSLHSEAFTGIVALVLAAIAVLNAWQQRFVRLFACLTLAGLLLALGKWNPLHGLLYAVVPLFEKARTPLRILSIFQLGLAVLAAVGADCVQPRTASSAWRIIGRALVAAGVTMFAFGVGVAVLQKPPLSDFAFLTALVALLCAALLAARQHGSISSRAFLVLAIGLVFLELGNGGAALYFDRTPDQRKSLLPELTRYSDISAFLRSRPGPVRVFTMAAAGDFNFGLWEGIDTPTGYGAGVTTNMTQFDWNSVRGQNILGVDYSLSKDNSPRPDQTLVFRGASGINVFQNADAFPRAWIVHRIEPVSSDQQAEVRLRDPAFDARHSAVLTGRAPELESCTGTEDARIARRTANSVAIDARLACRGMLVLSDTWYPGWSAQVDGQTAPIYQTDVALRGVVLQPGAHRLEFRYRPASAIVGALMSLLGVAGACGLAFWERRRART